MKTLIQIVCSLILVIFSFNLSFAEISIIGEIPQNSELGAYDINKFIDEYNSGKITIIDVRSFEEYSTAHLAGAINLPLDTGFAQSLDKLENYENVVLTCLSGNRASRAYKLIEETRPDLLSKVKFLDAKASYKPNGDLTIKPNN